MNNNSIKIIKSFKQIIKDNYINKSTIQGYIYDLNAFVKFLRIVKKEVVQINEDLIENYKKYLIFNNFSNQTINRRISMLNKFLKYLYEENILSENLSLILKTKKPLKNQNDILTLNDYKKILQTLDITKKSGLKYALIFHLLVKTQNKLKDIIDLKIKDIEKNSFEDVELSFLLEEYLKLAKPVKFIFENNDRTQITRQGINKKFNQCLKLSGINKNLSLSSLKNAQNKLF